MGNTKQIRVIERALWRAVYSIKWGGQGEPQWEGSMTPELKGQRELPTWRKKLLCKGHKAGTCLAKGRIARR